MKEEIGGDPTWDTVRLSLPTDVVDELQQHHQAKASLAIRLFLGFVSDAACSESAAFKDFLHSGRDGYDEPRGQAILLDAVTAWTSQALAGNRWKQATVQAYRGHVFHALATAAQGSDLRLPRISIKSSKFPRITDTVPFIRLGELDWPEFESIPSSQRDACALGLIRNHGIQVFETQENLFNFGREIMGDSAPNPSKWINEVDALKRLLDQEHLSWSASKRSIFAEKWSGDLSEDIAFLTDPHFWSDMGVPWIDVPNPARKTYRTDMMGLVADTVLSCFGPNIQSALAMQTVVAAETGWNRQPIQTLTGNPYIYRRSDMVRVGSGRFIASFKGRATHYVVGSDTNSVSRGLELDTFDAIWDQLCSNPNFADDADYATLNFQSDLLTFMDRYERMTSDIREFCDQTTSDRYFIAVSRSFKGGITSPDYDMGKNFPKGPASRKGATFSATRKSYLAVYRRSGASIAETREAAGQRSRGTLEANYLSDPSAVAGHLDAARLFQNSIQAMTIDEKMALKIGLTTDQLEWFSHCATASGIRSACGLGPVLSDMTTREDFIFFPQRDDYIDLYLTHKALKLAKRRIGERRWEIQGAYLYEMVMAITRNLLRNGFRNDFLQTIRETRLLFRSGTIALPPILEV